MSAATLSASAATPPALPAGATPALQIRSVSKVFDRLEAIRSISFDVADGEFVSLLGPSGCGKSTLLMMIAGLAGPTEGEIKINGAKVTRPAARDRRRVPVAGAAALAHGARQRAVSRRAAAPPGRAATATRALELLRMAKIDDFAGALPRQLSGGMRQRAAICRALVHDPALLLMDEPFSALDAITRDEMGVELLRIWQANRKTVVFVTHSIREAAFLSDRVLVMSQRPATIVDEVAIDLPRPRHIAMMEDEAFNRYVRHLRKAIEASHAS